MTGYSLILGPKILSLFFYIVAYRALKDFGLPENIFRQKDLVKHFLTTIGFDRRCMLEVQLSWLDSGFTKFSSEKKCTDHYDLDEPNVKGIDFPIASLYLKQVTSLHSDPFTATDRIIYSDVDYYFTKCDRIPPSSVPNILPFIMSFWEEGRDGLR